MAISRYSRSPTPRKGRAAPRRWDRNLLSSAPLPALLLRFFFIVGSAGIREIPRTTHSRQTHLARLARIRDAALPYDAFACGHEGGALAMASNQAESHNGPRTEACSLSPSSAQESKACAGRSRRGHAAGTRHSVRPSYSGSRGA